MRAKSPDSPAPLSLLPPDTALLIPIGPARGLDGNAICLPPRDERRDEEPAVLRETDRRRDSDVDEAVGGEPSGVDESTMARSPGYRDSQRRTADKLR